MADLVFVTPAGAESPTAPPAALTLLPHRVRELTGADEAAPTAPVTDLVIVDARGDLVAARTTCSLIRTTTQDWPMLLLVDESGLSAVSAEWEHDDLIVSSASPAEYDARIRLLLDATPKATTISSGPVVIDETAYQATVGGEPLDLTYTEFELLKFLVSHPGRVLTREQLLSEVWGYDYFGGTRTVDVHIRRLRAKLGSEYDGFITTVRNVGYRFSASR